MLKQFILYEDAELWVFNKPSGMHSTNDGINENTLANLILDTFPAQATLRDAGLVQRLDFDTSGCLLVARNESIQSALQTSFRVGQGKKLYYFIADGKLGSTIVKTMITARYRRSKKVTILPESSGNKRAQPATTAFKYIRAVAPTISLVEAQIEAGRRHQIRAHAAHVGHPLVGDALYGSNTLLLDFVAPRYHQHAPLFFLHSHKIEFTHPVRQKRITVTAPVPEWAEPFFQESE